MDYNSQAYNAMKEIFMAQFHAMVPGPAAMPEMYDAYMNAFCDFIDEMDDLSNKELQEEIEA